MKLSLKQSLLWIIGSTFLISGTSYAGYFYYRNWKLQRLADPKYRITALVQTGPEKEALKTIYLAELLDLSIDRPSHLYAFDLKEAEKKLISSPLIQKAVVKRIPPSALYIDFTTRKAVAWLYDFENMAIDQDGYAFPVYPFFTPKNLPEIYLGIDQLPDGPIETKEKELALKLLELLSKVPFYGKFQLIRIDVSKAFSESLGQREIVLWLRDEIVLEKGGRTQRYFFPKLIRLNPKNITQQLDHFLVLHQKMKEDYQKQIQWNKDFPGVVELQNRIIDFRVPQLAFINE